MKITFRSLSLRLPALLCCVSLLQPATATGQLKESGAGSAPPATSRAQDAKREKIGAIKPAIKPAVMPQRLVREGVAVEFSAGAAEQSGTLLEGGEAAVTFKITDTTTGQPVTGLRPAAWIDGKDNGPQTDEKNCRDKVQAFLQARLSARPDIDLNTYYVLALNEEANISVIDPMLGLGTTKLLTLVLLKSNGADWVMSADQSRLYVSMPLVNQVAVVDTATWKVTTDIDTGARPTRLRLQRDGKYLWVAYDGLKPEDRSGVTVIDTATNKTIARIETGAGAHDIALSSDDRYAFVTNRGDGTASVIDGARLAKLLDVKTGASPTAIAYSPAARAAYVADEVDGTIVAVNAERRAPAARVAAKPGLAALRFAPDGRHGFAVNRRESVVHIFDSASNRLLHTVPVGSAPDQVAFSKQFAYVRLTESEQVTLIRLGEIGRASIEQSVAKFPAGQAAPQASPKAMFAAAMTNAPGEGAMLVANAADQMIYYYMEGMAAPMGSFRNYRRQPLALMVWDASLRETAPGVYSTRARLNAHGSFDVAFLLDSPRIVNCFEMTIAENPALAKKRQVAIKIEPLVKAGRLTVGQPLQLKFKVIDTETGQPRADLKDMGTLAFLAPGVWQQREWARHVGDGIYEVTITPPQEGVYYIFFQCPSLGVQYRQIPHLILNAAKPSPARQTGDAANL